MRPLKGHHLVNSGFLTGADDTEHRRYGQLLDLLGTGMLILSATNAILMANQTASERIGDAPPAWLSPDETPLPVQALWPPPPLNPNAADGPEPPQPPRRINYRDPQGFVQAAKCLTIPLDTEGNRLLLIMQWSDLPAQFPEDQESQRLLAESSPPNRLKTLLDNEIHRARRYGTPFTLAKIIVDDLPNLRTRIGEPLSQCLLAGLGRLLVATLREIDIVVRYKDDEFLLILPNVGLNDALLGLERLRGIIETQPLTKEELRITVSGGVVEYAGETADALIERTHILLEYARTGARNRFCVDSDFF